MTDRYPWPARLFTLMSATGALLLLGQSLWFYLMGDYARILLPSLLAMVMVVAALLGIGRQNISRTAAYLMLICGYLMIAVELPRQSGNPALWIGLPPVLTLLLLPLGSAMLLNLVLTPIWLALLGNGQLDRDITLSYLTLVTVAALVPWELLRQHALLQATDPRDPECPAVTRSALHDRLAGEFERAALLGQPLAVLLIDLPQVEMAGEQFGQRTRQALLETFCRAVTSRSRQQDLLGRENSEVFWLVLPDTTESSALLVRQRLEQALLRDRLLDIGRIEMHARLCLPRPRETWPHFEQRLQAASQALLDT